MQVYTIRPWTGLATLGISQGNEVRSEMIYLAAITQTMVHIFSCRRMSITGDWPISVERTGLEATPTQARCPTAVSDD